MSVRPILLFAAVGLCIGHALVFNFVNDDAFISFRYADNLVRHGELVFNLGERVEGYTNFLWTLVMAGVMALGLDPVTWSKALGIALAVGALLIVARFTARMEGRKGPGDTLAPLLLAAAPGYACWATGGLETALFTFLVTGGWAAFLEEREPPAPGKKRLGPVAVGEAERGPARATGETRLEQPKDETTHWVHSLFRLRKPISGLWFAFAAMTRPEGVLLFGLCGLYRIGEMVSERRFKPTRQDWLWGGLFLLAFGPYYAWRFAYYGYPFPNTWYVKSGAQSFWGPGLNYVWDWIATHFLWVVPVLAVIKRGWPGSRQGRMLALTALFTLVMCIHVARVGGDFMALHRFLVPLLPMLAVVAATGLRALWAVLRERGHSGLRLGAGSTVLALLLTVHVVRVDQNALKIDSQGGVDSIGWLAWFADQCTTIGQWLAENTNENDVLATTAAGIIPFYARRPTLDLLGLNDAWIAHNVPATGNRPGHTKHAPPGYPEEKGVTIFIGHPEPSAQKPRGGGRPGYTFEAVQIPGLRIEGRKARTPTEAQSDAWWGYWRRVPAQKP